MPGIKNASQIIMIQNESTPKKTSNYTLQPVFPKEPSEVIDYLSFLR